MNVDIKHPVQSLDKSHSNSNQDHLYRCNSPEVTYPYPLYKDPAMEKLKLAHMKQNQVISTKYHLNCQKINPNGEGVDLARTSFRRLFLHEKGVWKS